MKTNRIAILWSVLVLAMLSACNDPTPVGASLLENDGIRVHYTDTVTLLTGIQPEDSVLVYHPNPENQLTNYLFGSMMDPVFGKVTATIYAQVQRTFYAKPDFTEAVLDSMVLVLPYRTDGFYGRTNETFGMEIRRVVEKMEFDSTYYSNASFQTNLEPIGHIEFVPNTVDSLPLISYTDDGAPEEVQTVPHLRVHLDEVFAENFFQADTNYFLTDSAFLDFFKGIQLVPTTVNNGLIAFDLRTNQAALVVYYHRDTLHYQYGFPMDLRSVRMSTFAHDYTGSVVEEHWNVPVGADSIAFIQGMAGVNMLIEVPHVRQWDEGVIINKAELEIPVVMLPGDDPDFSPPERILVAELTDDNRLIAIEDVTLNFGDLNKLDVTFGGLLETDSDGRQYYRANITGHFQRMAHGTAPPRIVITVFSKPDHARRVVVAGSKHPECKPVLKLTWTEL